MRTIFVLTAACALFATVGTTDALAKKGGKGNGNAAMSRGLDRADFVAGRHGSSGRVIARGRGANAFGFCPPGQRKKAGRGSRFMC
jgi:hypothetical protein